MKKKNLHLWIWAALICGLSLAVTSCKDDDKNEPSAEEKAEQAKEQADIFWGVMDELAGIDAITDDYQNKTFEPIIGTASQDNPQHRIVATNDMNTAANRFNWLIGEEKVDENTAEYTWQNDAVGTLIYRKSTDGKSWATVDVSIKQMPRLERIIYMKPSQGSDNKAFEGTAYYRFGDIVKKKNKDGKDEYWICVRPCFGPEEKEKSHWISIDRLPSNNIWSYTGSNGIDYALPTGLGDNDEHAQNFAEMLYAICFPNQWEDNIINNPKVSVLKKGVPMFGDFNKTNLKYHRKYFWKRVQEAWGNNGILMEKVFGLSDPVTLLSRMLSGDGLYLLTKGYSWITKGPFATNSPTLYRYHFTNGTGVESNMHHGGKKEKVTKEVIKSEIPLNVKDYTPFGWINNPFFGTDTRHYVVRFASGAQLASDRSENPKEKLNGVEDVYNYNKYYNIDVNENPAPETFDESGNSSSSQQTGFKDRAYYTVGDIVKDENDNLWVCVQPSAHHNADLFKEQPYSYFVSFDLMALGGAQLVFLPTSKELTAQILFSLEVLFHNYQKHVNNPISEYHKRVQHINEKLQLKLGDLIAVRDTLHKYSNTEQAAYVECSFVSAIYREGNELRVLRLIGDYTVEQANGVRDWSWKFYTNYSNSNTPMRFEDLGDPDMISSYNKDKWVTLPWHDIYTKSRTTDNTGPRTATMPVQEDDRYAFYLVSGRNDQYKDIFPANLTMPTNMYREPLIAFAVHRVWDAGVKSTRFEDSNETFTEYSMMKDTNPSFAEDETGATSLISDVYIKYCLDDIFLNGEKWQFRMDNTTPFTKD
jgi:hypothetical protein